MTREQINNLIDKKIMGQGNQVDLGTALPSILRGIMSASASTQEVDDFEDFDETTSYSEGDIVRKDGKLYKFTADHDGEWDEDDVEQTNVMTEIQNSIPTYQHILEVNSTEPIGTDDWMGYVANKYALIVVNVGEYNTIAGTILPVSFSSDVIYQYQGGWRIGSLLDFGIQEDTTWEDALDYLDEHSSPIATENDFPKPFTLLANPSPSMTTLEELATTGITEEVIEDMAKGKYTGIITTAGYFYPILESFGGDYPRLSYGMDLTGSTIDIAYVVKIVTNIDNSIGVTIFEV